MRRSFICGSGRKRKHNHHCYDTADNCEPVDRDDSAEFDDDDDYGEYYD